MNVAGFDVSTKVIDCVLVPLEEGTAPPIWGQYPLSGRDAWERCRMAGDVIPSRGSIAWDELYAAGIEVPFGFSSAKVAMVIGALLSRMPPGILIERWPHNSWRKALGMKGGGASAELKQAAVDYSLEQISNTGAPMPSVRKWTVDAHEAHCIAIATRNAIK